MGRRLPSLGHRGQRARSSRIVTCLLILLIGYGSAAEAMHQHGAALRNTPAAQLDPSVINSSGGDSSGNPLAQRDCLICQFHRGLSSTALFAPMLLLAPSAATALVSPNRVSFFSVTASLQRGRAPPVTCLIIQHTGSPVS